jgi:hypothetical protein
MFRHFSSFVGMKQEQSSKAFHSVLIGKAQMENDEDAMHLYA